MVGRNCESGKLSIDACTCSCTEMLLLKVNVCGSAHCCVHMVSIGKAAFE